jgi:type I restriction enzyme S subunit
MSKLDELIQELCPDGVEYKVLDEVAHYAKDRIPASDVDENTYVGVENLLQNKQGKTRATAVPTTGNIIAYKQGNILIGNIRPYLRKVWLADCNGGTNGDVLAVQINEIEKLEPRYLYYVLSSEAFFQYDIQNSKGAKMPRGSKEAVMKYPIPVLPLPVQREIVRILDNFTELTAELTARQKQYEYYRNQLLTFKYDTKYERLGDTCSMKSGKAIPSTQISVESTDATPFQCFGGNGVRGYVANASHHGEFPIIGRQGALCGNINYAAGDFYATEHAVVVESKGKYLQRFLYHILISMNLNQYKSQGAQPGLAVGNLENLVAPVPPLEIQQRLVDVLDNFDTICSDLNIGLPAEIKARQKQYEYYRDMLLTFAETGPTILTRRDRA